MNKDKFFFIPSVPILRCTGDVSLRDTRLKGYEYFIYRQKNLMKSMAQQGQKNPVFIRPYGNEGFRVEPGKNRWFIMRSINWHHYSAIVHVPEQWWDKFVDQFGDLQMQQIFDKQTMYSFFEDYSNPSGTKFIENNGWFNEKI